MKKIEHLIATIIPDSTLQIATEKDRDYVRILHHHQILSITISTTNTNALCLELIAGQENIHSHKEILHINNINDIKSLMCDLYAEYDKRRNHHFISSYGLSNYLELYHDVQNVLQNKPVDKYDISGSLSIDDSYQGINLNHKQNDITNAITLDTQSNKNIKTEMGAYNVVLIGVLPQHNKFFAYSLYFSIPVLQLENYPLIKKAYSPPQPINEEEDKLFEKLDSLPLLPNVKNLLMYLDLQQTLPNENALGKKRKI